MMAHPSLPLFTDAYLADTMDLSTEEHGAYLLLLITLWRAPDLRLPDDDRRLARFVRASPRKWRDLRPRLADYFIIEDGHWRHKRIEKEHKFVTEYRAKQAAKAKQRWGNNPPEKNDNDDAVAKPRDIPEAMPDACRTHAPSPSPSQEEKDSGAYAPANRPIDLKANLFRSGKAFLTSHGIQEKQAGSLLGRWRRDHGDAAVIEVLSKADAEGVSDPVAYIEAALRGKRNGTGNHNQAPRSNRGNGFAAALIDGDF